MIEKMRSTQVAEGVLEEKVMGLVRMLDRSTRVCHHRRGCEEKKRDATRDGDSE
jgi:hypothetical protein